MPDIEAFVRSWINPNQTRTHWEGCEYNHYRCAITWALNQLDMERAKNKQLQDRITSLERHGPRKWGED